MRSKIRLQIFKILAVVSFLTFSTVVFSQEKGMVRIDDIQEQKIDTLVTDFNVLTIIGDQAIIRSVKGGRQYRVKTDPVLNPFKYDLQAERVYRMAVELDRIQVEKWQSRGQTRTIMARIIYFTVSNDQLKRDQMQLQKYIDSPDGFDRSPRY